MTDLLSSVGAGEGARVAADPPPPPPPPPATPLWVKGFGVAAIVLILVFVGLHVTGNSPMHIPSSASTQHAAQLP